MTLLKKCFRSKVIGWACLLVLVFLHGCSGIPGISGLKSIFDKGKSKQFSENIYNANLQNSQNNFQPQINSLPPKEAIAKSNQLKQSGNLQGAMNVMQRAYMAYPQDPYIASEYGRLLTAIGKPQQAQAVLIQAINSGITDWKLFSSLGVAYDRAGQHKQAQKAYASALAQSPYEAAVYNNLGLSYAYEGNIEQAEGALRKAVSLPGATPKMHSNLKVILEYSGVNYDHMGGGELDLSNGAGQHNNTVNNQYKHPQNTNSIPQNTGSLQYQQQKIPQIEPLAGTPNNYDGNIANFSDVEREASSVVGSSSILGSASGGGEATSILGSSYDKPSQAQKNDELTNIKSHQYPKSPKVNGPHNVGSISVNQPLSIMPGAASPKYAKAPQNAEVNIPQVDVKGSYGNKKTNKGDAGLRGSKNLPWYMIKKMDGLYPE